MSRLKQMNPEDEIEAGIDMSPLIDCVFILLIFFIVTTRFVDKTGSEVDRPQPAAAQQTESTTLSIELSEKGEVLVDGRNIGLAGVRPVVAKRMLANPELPVNIKVAVGPPSSLMVQVEDEVLKAGVEKITYSRGRVSR